MTASPLGMPTGFSMLDQVLPQRGWPVAGLSDIRIAAAASGELRLLAPCLRKLTQAGRTVVFLVPPSFSYAPMLIQHGVDLKFIRVVRHAQPLDGLADIEAALKTGDFGAIVAWMPEPAPDAATQRDALRRLQLAARLSYCPAILFRCNSASDPALADPATLSAASLHLQVDPVINDTVRVRRLNFQRTETIAPVVLSLPPILPRQRRVPASRTASAHDTAGLVTQAAGSRSGHSSSLSVSAAIGSIHASFDAVAAVFRTREAAPARTPWPFKQRRKSPDGPSMPVPARIARAW